MNKKKSLSDYLTTCFPGDRGDSIGCTGPPGLKGNKGESGCQGQGLLWVFAICTASVPHDDNGGGNCYIKYPSRISDWFVISQSHCELGVAYGLHLH